MKQIYLHIDNPKILPPETTFEYISNIEPYEDNSIDIIIVNDLFDFYETKNIKTILNIIKNKIKPGGKLIIQSVDLKQVSIAVAFNQISVEIVKHILYPFKKAIYTLYDIEKILIESGFEIQNKKYINIFEYYITVKKNG